MKRVLRTSLLPALLLALTACGAAVPAGTVAPAHTTIVDMSAPEAGAAGEPIPTPTAVVEQNPGPVTAIMQTLELTGEQYAAEGDPDAPITVIEFSDYG